ncbi:MULTISPECIES: hypothetical protein [Micrococcales]|uniref:hypothetical protein n=1 Tax=Micrococcales TaxID=85006 RepID=UPI000C3AC45F|nr:MULTISPECIES: hypothetical protein [Brevibacterium]SMY00396.1 hypothetical protein BSP109_03209 [Brevibacterium sp. Mu109]
MDPATPADRRRRRLLIATIAGGIVLLLLVGVGIYGLLRGPAPRTGTTPTDPTVPAVTAPPPGSSREGPVAVPQVGGPEAFARAVAGSLFTWDTTTGHNPSDYAQMLADVAADEEADALAGDVRAYLPTVEAWGQLRPYQTRQWLTIDAVVVPDAWATAVAQAAPGQIPAGTVAYTIEGTRHRDGTWGTEPVEASRPVSFTVFAVCTPPVPGRGSPGLCELLRLSQLDNPLR